MFFNRPAPIYTGNRRTKVLRHGKRILEVVVESRKQWRAIVFRLVDCYERCVDALLTTCDRKKKRSQHYIRILVTRFNVIGSFNAVLPQTFFELQIDPFLSNLQSISPYGVLLTN